MDGGCDIGGSVFVVFAGFVMVFLVTLGMGIKKPDECRHYLILIYLNKYSLYVIVDWL